MLSNSLRSLVFSCSMVVEATCMYHVYYWLSRFVWLVVKRRLGKTSKSLKYYDQDYNLFPKDSEKVLGAGIPVDNNKPKSDRLFGTVYLKILRNISSNSIWKSLLLDVTLKKSVSFGSNSLKMLMLFSMKSGNIFICQ